MHPRHCFDVVVTETTLRVLAFSHRLCSVSDRPTKARTLAEDSIRQKPQLAVNPVRPAGRAAPGDLSSCAHVAQGITGVNYGIKSGLIVRSCPAGA